MDFEDHPVQSSIQGRKKLRFIPKVFGLSWKTTQCTYYLLSYLSFALL